MPPDRRPSVILKSPAKSELDKKVEEVYRTLGFRGRDELRRATPYDFNTLPDNLKKNRARIQISLGMKSIDMILGQIYLPEQHFDPKHYYRWYDELTSGTSEPKLPDLPEGLDTKISFRDLEKMKIRHRMDPAKISFLTTSGIHDLPPLLRKLIRDRQQTVPLPIHNQTLNEYTFELLQAELGGERTRATFNRFQKPR